MQVKNSTKVLEVFLYIISAIRDTIFVTHKTVKGCFVTKQNFRRYFKMAKNDNNQNNNQDNNNFCNSTNATPSNKNQNNDQKNNNQNNNSQNKNQNNNNF